jgi:hypothetical protein
VVKQYEGCAVGRTHGPAQDGLDLTLPGGLARTRGNAIGVADDFLGLGQVRAQGAQEDSHRGSQQHVGLL